MDYATNNAVTAYYCQESPDRRTSTSHLFQIYNKILLKQNYFMKLINFFKFLQCIYACSGYHTNIS